MRSVLPGKAGPKQTAVDLDLRQQRPGTIDRNRVWAEWAAAF
jgi:hypothetical protein